MEPYCHPAREFGRVTCRKAIVGSHRDLLKQILDISLRNPAGLELRGLDIAIKECDSQEVGEAMVGVLLCVDIVFRTKSPTPGEIISVLENFSLDAQESRCCSSSKRADRSNPV